MMLLIYDKSNNRFKEVHTNQHMTIETVNSIMNQEKAPKYRRVFAGEIFKDTDDDKEQQDDQKDENDEILQEELELDNSPIELSVQEPVAQNISLKAKCQEQVKPTVGCKR